MIDTILFINGMITGWLLITLCITHATKNNLDRLRDELNCELQELRKLDAQNQKENNS